MNYQNNSSILLNWKLFYIGISSLLSGYLLMAISNLNFIRLTLSPILILAGFGLIAAAILVKK